MGEPFALDHFGKCKWLLFLPCRDFSISILNFMLQTIKRLIISVLEFIRHKKSYAQDGEDVALDSFYEGKKGYRGFFVDIGAHHPVRFSNTWMFYRKGWRGINIDPTPGSMIWFRRLRSGDLNLEIGVGAKSGELKFHCFNDPALNTFDEKVAASRNTGKPYKIIKTVSVPIAPLSEILEKHLPPGRKIDFFSIDVEGFDLEVLKSNDWGKFSPDFVLVEDTTFQLENPTASEIYNYLKINGYSMVASLRRTIIYQKQN